MLNWWMMLFLRWGEVLFLFVCVLVMLIWWVCRSMILMRLGLC